MFVMNMNNSEIKFRKHDDARTTVLQPKKGFRIQGGKAEMDYYRRFRNAGLQIVADEVYFKANGIAIPAPVAKVEVPQTDALVDLLTSGAGITDVVTDKIEFVDKDAMRNEKEMAEAGAGNTETTATTVVTDVDNIPPATVEGTVITTPDSFDSELPVMTNLETDPEDLRGDAIYTYEFLTRNKAKTILENRGVNVLVSWSAEECKNRVLESNPIQE